MEKGSSLRDSSKNPREFVARSLPLGGAIDRSLERSSSGKSPTGTGRGESQEPLLSDRLTDLQRQRMEGGTMLESPDAKHSDSEFSYKDQNEDPDATVTLPKAYVVKYLGKRDSRGLWGIKHTRKPVDEMVAEARTMKAGATLPLLKLEVSTKGVYISEMPQNSNKRFEPGLYPIETISYGVQDLMYSRVFAMIIVRDTVNALERHPFICHGFVCDSRLSARSLTMALATAFRQFSKTVSAKQVLPTSKKFAIDLRTTEEITADMDIPCDSEA